MRRDPQRLYAMLLAAAAVHGLAVGPLVHAEQHAAEADEDEAEHDHDHDGHHHSHSPGQGPHGAGTLSHLALALQATSMFVAEPPAAAEHGPLLGFEEQLHEKQPHLIPERSQAPPRR